MAALSSAYLGLLYSMYVNPVSTNYPYILQETQRIVFIFVLNNLFTQPYFE